MYTLALLGDFFFFASGYHILKDDIGCLNTYGQCYSTVRMETMTDIAEGHLILNTCNYAKVQHRFKGSKLICLLMLLFRRRN